jgi:DNA-binding transcriptional regulator YiaG
MMDGSELREIRKASRLSQSDFGRLVGMGRVAVSDWERNVNYIPVSVEAIAYIIKLHPEILLELERYRGMRK